MGVSFQSPLNVLVPPGCRLSDTMYLARCWGFCFHEEGLYPINEHTPIYHDYPAMTALEAHLQGWQLVSDIRFCAEKDRVLMCPKCVEKLKLEAKRLEEAGWA